MATIQDISRSFNHVKTAGQAKVAIGDTLNAINLAGDRNGSAAREHLERYRKPVQGWWNDVKNLPDNLEYSREFASRRNILMKAYVEISGVDAQSIAASKISLFDEIAEGAKKLPRKVGQTAGEIVGGVGDAAGKLVGGVLSGLGPTLAIVAVIAVFFFLVKGRTT